MYLHRVSSFSLNFSPNNKQNNFVPILQKELYFSSVCEILLYDSHLEKTSGDRCWCHTICGRTLVLKHITAFCHHKVNAKIIGPPTVPGWTSAHENMRTLWSMIIHVITYTTTGDCNGVDWGQRMWTPTLTCNIHCYSVDRNACHNLLWTDWLLFFTISLHFKSTLCTYIGPKQFVQLFVGSESKLNLIK